MLFIEKHFSSLILLIYENDNLLSKLLVLNDEIDDIVNRIAAGNTYSPPLKLPHHLHFHLDPSIQRDQATNTERANNNCKPCFVTFIFHFYFLFLTYFIYLLLFIFTMIANLMVAASTLGDGIMEEIALDFDDEDVKGKHFLIPSPSVHDGASSSSSSKKKRKEKKERKEDKKGKLAVKVTCKICDDGILLFFSLFLFSLILILHSEYDSWYLVHELATCKHIYCIDCLRYASHYCYERRQSINNYYKGRITHKGSKMDQCWGSHAQTPLARKRLLLMM